MPVTVGEALQMHAFHRCRLLTGQAGLDNPIKWVNILEILDDLRHIEPGEFLITTGYGFNFAALAQQQRLLEQFAANRLAALAVQIGHYINEIPASFVQAAAAAGIPVLEVPAEISFKQLTRPLLNELMRQELADQSDTKGEEGDHFKVLASQSRALMQKILEGQNPEKYSDNLKTLRIFTHAKFYMLLIAPQPAAAAGGPVISGQQEPAGDRLLQNLMHMFVQYKLPFLATRHNHKLAALIQPSNPEPEQVIHLCSSCSVNWNSYSLTMIFMVGQPRAFK